MMGFNSRFKKDIASPDRGFLINLGQMQDDHACQKGRSQMFAIAQTLSRIGLLPATSIPSMKRSCPTKDKKISLSHYLEGSHQL
ncbi:hypothetical protein ABBQ38_001512 [Trebouxia sp. C0009 RCD-2024]